MSDISKFSVYGRMIARAGERDALIETFKRALQSGIGGLESWSINSVPDNPDTIWVTQIWTDKAAHDTGTRSDDFTWATKRAMTLIAEPPEGSYGQVAYLHYGRTV